MCVCNKKIIVNNNSYFYDDISPLIQLEIERERKPITPIYCMDRHIGRWSSTE